MTAARWTRVFADEIKNAVEKTMVTRWTEEISTDPCGSPENVIGDDNKAYSPEKTTDTEWLRVHHTTIIKWCKENSTGENPPAAKVEGGNGQPSH